MRATTTVPLYMHTDTTGALVYARNQQQSCVCYGYGNLHQTRLL